MKEEVESQTLEKEAEEEPRRIKLVKREKAKEPEAEVEEPRRLKLAKKKKKPDLTEEAQETKVELRPDTEDTEHEDRPRPKKRSEQSSLVMYGVGAFVGGIVLILIMAIALGSRREPKKDPGPPPIVVIPPPRPEPPPPERIDTAADKMTVGPYELPIMIASLAKANGAALRREYLGPFTAFPSAPEKPTTLQLRRLTADGPASVRTLSEALVRTKPDEWTVIEIHDDGPIWVSNLPALTQRQIVLRGAPGHRPLLAWDMPKQPADAKRPAKLLTLSQGTLVLDNLDIVMKSADAAPALLFDLPDTHFYARDCTFSLVGKPAQSITLVRHGPAENPLEARKTQTWLQRCHLRGPEAALLDLHDASTALLVEGSLIVGQQQPLIQMRCRDEDALALHCVRSTLVAGQTLLRWQPTGKQGGPQIAGQILDSILSRDDATAARGDMLHLTDDTDLTKLSWRAANSVYAGWKQMLASTTRNIADLEGWRGQLLYSGGDRTVAETWPSNPPSSLEEQSANTFLPFPSPVGFAALTGPGAAGSVIGWLPTAPDNWLDRVFEPASAPALAAGSLQPPQTTIASDSLFHGAQLNLNQVDLGAFLADKLQKTKPAPRVVMHLYGKGPCATSTLRIKGVQHLVLYFVQPKDLFRRLYAGIRPTGLSQRLPLIEMTGGHLELIGARVQLSPVTSVPTIVQVHDGQLTLTRCRLEGPLAKSADAFQALVSVRNTGPSPATLLLRDNYLAAGKLLVQMHDQVQLKARNNVFLSLGDCVRIDANSPTLPLTHVLDHNTWAARQSIFTLRTGPEFQAVGRVLVHAESNAFLHPFADDAEKGTLLRGAGPWATRPLELARGVSMCTTNAGTRTLPARPSAIGRR